MRLTSQFKSILFKDRKQSVDLFNTHAIIIIVGGQPYKKHIRIKFILSFFVCIVLLFLGFFNPAYLRAGSCSNGGADDCDVTNPGGCASGCHCVRIIQESTAGYCVTNSGGGGGVVGGVCTGCYPGPAIAMYPVDSVTVTKTSNTSALISWVYGAGVACGKRGHTDVFVGTNKAVVDNNCGVPNYDPESAPLSPGCNWHRYLSNTTTSYNTADPLTRPVTLDPNRVV